MLFGRTLFLIIGAASLVFGQTEVRQYDVIVYGGTAGGTMAAIAAAEGGSNVMLLCPSTGS